MTDRDIIKALECCLSSNDLVACWECPAVKLDVCCDGSSKISNGITDKVIDLINRQQAERDAMLEDLQFRTNQVIEQQAEIERLQVRLRKERHQFADLGKMYSEIRAEVIKEYIKNAEKELYIKQDEHRKHWEEYLKNHRRTKAYQDYEQAVDNWLRGYGEAVQDILSVNDNLVKEMVGDNNGE